VTDLKPVNKLNNIQLVYRNMVKIARLRLKRLMKLKEHQIQPQVMELERLTLIRLQLKVSLSKVQLRDQF
jgi:hypothetical protein